jgi:hypothetical protein
MTSSPDEMSDKTISELLFEQFCEENSIRYCRVKQQVHKTPDYDIYFGEHLVIAEVKQIDQNKDDEKRSEQGRRRGRIAFWEKSGRRVRIKIDSAKKQLKLRSQGKYPAILVLYDNVPTKSTDAVDIKTAMYGHESVRIALPGSAEDMSIEIENVGFGSERKFTPNDNTTFSAIALLYKFGETLHLSVFHNVYAKCPIDPSWLRLSTVRHFTLGPQIQGAFQEWREV